MLLNTAVTNCRDRFRKYDKDRSGNLSFQELCTAIDDYLLGASEQIPIGLVPSAMEANFEQVKTQHKSLNHRSVSQVANAVAERTGGHRRDPAQQQHPSVRLAPPPEQAQSRPLIQNQAQKHRKYYGACSLQIVGSCKDAPSTNMNENKGEVRDQSVLNTQARRLAVKPLEEACTNTKPQQRLGKPQNIQVDEMPLYVAPRVKVRPRHNRRKCQVLPELHLISKNEVELTVVSTARQPIDRQPGARGQRRASLPSIVPPRCYFKGLRRNSVLSMADKRPNAVPAVVGVSSSILVEPRKNKYS